MYSIMTYIPRFNILYVIAWEDFYLVLNKALVVVLLFINVFPQSEKMYSSTA